MWNPAGVDEAVWERMREHFTEEQIVELGYFVSLTFGQQRWIKTLGIGHNEVTVPGVDEPEAGPAGLAPDAGRELSVNGQRPAPGAPRQRQQMNRGADELRAIAPHVLQVYEETRRTVLSAGIVEPELKALCVRYLAEDPDVMDHAQDPERFDERQRAALAWADAIAWDGDRANDALWARLQSAFTEPELVELGYSIAIELGQRHWLSTHAIAKRT